MQQPRLFPEVAPKALLRESKIDERSMELAFNWNVVLANAIVDGWFESPDAPGHSSFPGACRWQIVRQRCIHRNAMSQQVFQGMIYLGLIE